MRTIIIVLKWSYNNEVRRKHIKPYYHRHPSMCKFQELINISNKRDTFRLMIYIYNINYYERL